MLAVLCSGMGGWEEGVVVGGSSLDGGPSNHIPHD